MLPSPGRHQRPTLLFPGQGSLLSCLPQGPGLCPVFHPSWLAGWLAGLALFLSRASGTLAFPGGRGLVFSAFGCWHNFAFACLMWCEWAHTPLCFTGVSLAFKVSSSVKTFLKSHKRKFPRMEGKRGKAAVIGSTRGPQGEPQHHCLNLGLPPSQLGGLSSLPHPHFPWRQVSPSISSSLQVCKNHTHSGCPIVPSRFHIRPV